MNAKIKTFDKYFRYLQTQSNIPVETDSCQDQLLSELHQHLSLVEIRTQELQAPLLLAEEKRIPTKSIFPKVSPEQDILLTGSIGLAGTVIMSRYFRDELITRLPGWMIDDALALSAQTSVYPALDLLDKFNVSAAYPIGEGGLRRVLYQIGKDTKKGYRIHPHKVPVNQITIEFCEFFNLDPWSLLSCGSTLLITPHGNSLMRELETLKIPAAIIGYTTGDNDKLLTYGDVQSRVNRPDPDELLSLLL